MSLVPTYTLLSNNKWYKNPVLGEHSWFLCFDDDDPIEIVIIEKDFYAGLTPESIIKKLNIDGWVTSKAMHSQRLFGSKNHFKHSVAFFIVANSAPNVNFLLRHDGVYDTMLKKEGVYYDYQRQVTKLTCPEYSSKTNRRIK